MDGLYTYIAGVGSLSESLPPIARSYPPNVTQVDFETGREGSLLHTPLSPLVLLPDSDKALVRSSNDDLCVQVWRRVLTEHAYTELVGQ